MMEDDTRQPALIKAVLGALGLSALGGLLVLPGVRLWMVLVVVLVFAFLLGGFFLYQRNRQRRQSARFLQSVEGQGSGAIGPGSAETKRALDDLRVKFQGGVQEWRRTTGRDLYTLPWYVIMGESGAGKTEAVRAALLDEMHPSVRHHVPGPGGTVNMNWWFTYRAVILDTAGRMVVPEKGQAADSPEWREFLRLLRKSRPNCPINGLLLVLSVESLIKDSAETISQKAGKLSEQLNLIQNTLDVRFPVYLMITKCDLLPGFREFCDGITDPLLQHQILGWSNPEPLDAGFRPELVEDHLNSVAARIRRRRLGMLRDGDVMSSRLDEATLLSGGTGFTPPHASDARDSLFALPDSLCRLAPRLRRYLETIFAGAQSSVYGGKPVFLRGIYFSSSMREGSALDEALAMATGLPLDQLSAVQTATESRAFFLKDLFLEKVFPEQGLVTQARNTLQLLRRRKLAVYGTATAVLLGVLALAEYSRRDLRASIGKELAYWQHGAAGWTAQGEWRTNLIAQPGAEGRLEYLGDRPLTNSGLRGITWEDYHSNLRNFMTNDLAPGWIFAPIRLFADRGFGDREEARRVLFERGAVIPLVRLAQARMGAMTSLTEGDRQALQGALATLVEVESAIAARTNGSGSLNEESAKRLMDPLFKYLFAREAPGDLIRTFQATYPTNWPPRLLSGGVSLETNRGIARGLEVLLEDSRQAQDDVRVQLKGVTNLVNALESYHQAESQWLDSAVNTPSDALLNTNALLQAFQAVAHAVQAVANGMDLNKPLLEKLQEIEAQAQKTSSNAFADLRISSIKGSLSKEVASRLRDFSEGQIDEVRTVWQSRSNAVAHLDLHYLARVTNATGAPGPAYRLRHQLYEEAMAVAGIPVEVTTNHIGSTWSNYARLGSSLALSGRYTGPMAMEATNSAQRVAEAAVEVLKRGYARQYAKHARELLDLYSRSQVVSEDLHGALTFFTRVRDDLGANNCPEALYDSLTTQLAWAHQRFLAHYVQERKQQMADAERFPANLKASPAASLSVGQLLELRDRLDGFMAETNQFSGGPFSLEELSGLNELNSLFRRRAVIEAILDGRGAQSGRIRFVHSDHQEDPDLNEMRLRYVHYCAQDSSADKVWSYIDLSRPQEFKFRLDQPLFLVLSGNTTVPSDPPSIKPVGAPLWSALAMLRDGERKEDGIVWEVKPTVPVDGDPTRSLGLKLEVLLDRPMPGREEW
jgi:hypothetical protein